MSIRYTTSGGAIKCTGGIYLGGIKKYTAEFDLPRNNSAYDRNSPKTVHRLVLCAGGIFYGKRDINSGTYNIAFIPYTQYYNGVNGGPITSIRPDGEIYKNITEEEEAAFYGGSDTTTIPDFMCNSYTTGTSRITIYKNVPLEYQTERKKSCYNSREVVFPSELKAAKAHDWKPYKSEGNYCSYYGQKSLMFDEITGNYTYSYAMIANNFS